jgi:diacylglycerol O-acyltransferase / wax synthase
VQQLSGLDASFLSMETATTFGHVGGVSIFGEGSNGRSVRFEDVRRQVAERLPLLPPYRRRLVEVPLGLDRPYWIEDPDFDLDFHVREIALPPPGHRDQLAEQVARIHGRPLDRSRPLWEIYVITGLEDGAVALYTKTHHAAIDGVSGSDLMSVLLDTAPQKTAVPAPEPPRPSERVPSSMELLARTVGGAVFSPRRALRVQRRMARATAVLARQQAGPWTRTAMEALGRVPLVNTLPFVRGWVGSDHDGEEALSRPGLPAPRTSFNKPITAHRRFAYASLPFDDVKAIKSHFGVTVNDVVMAISAGALRQWLQERQELPTTPLLAMTPVSVRKDTDGNTFGNKVSGMIAALPTHEPDARRRLELAHEAMRAAKEQHAALPANVLSDFSQFTPPGLVALAARLSSRMRIADFANPPFNVTISNIPGPQHPLYSAGVRQLALHPVSLVTDGLGLNISVVSYDGGLHFGLVACRELVPDLWALMDHHAEALAELRKLVP